LAAAKAPCESGLEVVVTGQDEAEETGPFDPVLEYDSGLHRA
jgi:hypothetical protein